MGAVWFVRSRQIAARFRFWLAIFGYNPRDHSISHKIYLIYAAIFYTLWSFMVLTLLANGASQVLAATQIAPPARAALALSLAGLMVWILMAALKASRRSPVLFSEEDAYLICQTPVDRRAVAVAWLAGQWPPSGMAAGAIAVTLGFGVVEAASPAGLTTADLPRYLLAGLQITSLVLPLHLGLTALSWALGAYRLSGTRQVPHLAWLPLSIAAVIATGLFYTTAMGNVPSPNLLIPLAQPIWIKILAPLAIPLQAGFGLIAWWPGLLAAVLVGGLGLVTLAWQAGDLSLGRAALESRSIPAQMPGGRTVSWQQAGEMSARRWLGLQRQASRLPAREGLRVLIWKDLIQSSRSGLIKWLVFALASLLFGLGISIVNDWGLRAWLVLLWVVVIGQAATRRLHNDLAFWNIFRQLPLTAERIILADAAAPLVSTTLLSWLGLVVGVWLGADPILAMTIGLLVPLLAANIILAAALDILRHARAASLLAGDVPQPGIQAVLLGIAIVCLSAVIVWQLQTFGLFLAIWLVLLSGSWLLRLAAGRLRRMH